MLPSCCAAATQVLPLLAATLHNRTTVNHLCMTWGLSHGHTIACGNTIEPRRRLPGTSEPLRRKNLSRAVPSFLQPG
jgi:hypothetical protein